MLNCRLNGIYLGLAAGVLLTLGCNRANTTPLASRSIAGQQVLASHDHATHAHGSHAQGVDPEVSKALASLSAVDRAAAQKQKICPVTDEPLGSMGAPMKVSVQGKDVFICCEGCSDALKDDPTTYLAKLPR